MVQLPKNCHPASLSVAPVFVQFPQDVGTLEKDQNMKNADLGGRILRQAVGECLSRDVWTGFFLPHSLFSWKKE